MDETDVKLVDVLTRKTMRREKHWSRGTKLHYAFCRSKSLNRLITS